ncbi:type II toxin-antitoxin system VapC family toxin [Deinococcus yavapaiensis]|uniref:PIN domain nuclease of toxin-antitoxin system n=1 Tax=Deinococcus yavapaiensis KR-236 TaxID=694435 RepID=A0A318SE03_9DEIO|nr:type II toxin-antitoxin system VapC family toxin [Deinococcus yavapaiensis]PYE50988.1 PIN domain nuclease of toxin-antitoxin system [Deinococcus yavapaiensis KR-236]
MVIDASALLAFFQDELGADVVEAALAKGAVMSSVNITEVIGKLVGSGVAPENEVRDDILNLGLEIAAFDETQAVHAGFFYARRSPYNLSLGDCACLALAETRKLEVLTAERTWQGIPDLRVRVHLIR